MRRRYLNRGTTPLWWADAPFDLVQRINREARASVRWFHTGVSDPVLGRQSWLRRVSVEFHRRLREERIYIEGASE